MNTNPDETKLALWLDDELHGEELAAVESWASAHPEHLAAREEVRKWRGLMASAIPAAEEPPYAEFFNGRVARTIREQTTESHVAAAQRRSWQSLLMPLAACAGMVLAFWLGGKTAKTAIPEINVAGAPKAIPVDPILYTPIKGVKAEWFSSAEASATVIVLNGVDAIPDTMDFSQTASHSDVREMDSTAEIQAVDMEKPSL
jgi:hypothetical protein